MVRISVGFRNFWVFLLCGAILALSAESSHAVNNVPAKWGFSTPNVISIGNLGYGFSSCLEAATDTYAYSGTSNRLSTITPATGPVKSIVFDANGSTVNDAVNQFTYDTRGRLTQATTVLGAVQYQVNSLGQRIRKTGAPGDTVFHYDAQGRLIAESNAAGAVQKEYIYLGDIPVAVIQ